MRIYKGVHPQTDHNKHAAQKVNGHIRVRVRICNVAGAEQIQKRPFKNQADGRKEDPRCHQKRKRISHDPLRLFLVSPAPFNGTQRRSAHAEQIGKRDHDRDHRKAEPQARQGFRRILRHMADVNPIHYIIKHVDQLCQRHGQCQIGDIFHHAALGKIILNRRHLNASHRLSCCRPPSAGFLSAGRSKVPGRPAEPSRIPSPQGGSIPPPVPLSAPAEAQTKLPPAAP